VRFICSLHIEELKWGLGYTAVRNVLTICWELAAELPSTHIARKRAGRGHVEGNCFRDSGSDPGPSQDR
jgi:hypothetical protein